MMERRSRETWKRKSWRDCSNAPERKKVVRESKGNQNTGNRNLEALGRLDLRGRRESKQQAEKEVELSKQPKPPVLSGRRNENQGTKWPVRGWAREGWDEKITAGVED